MFRIGVIIVLLLSQLTGCAAPSKVIMHSSNIDSKDIVTVYVPQSFLTKVNGEDLEKGIDLTGGGFVELIELSPGMTLLQGDIKSNYIDYGSTYSFTEWNFEFSTELKAGHVYFFYWEDSGEHPFIFGRDLGSIRDEFNPVINKFGIVEEGREVLRKRHLNYYSDLKGDGVPVIISNIKPV